ncbi:hypothetical protein CALVIDRAFT_599998 [Calocera viscosa TUFC12733]|uniref:Nucleoporin protein Ndc1-Nup n=1 Tax=Calocera viscosa (strain TUFC12733) TaxID=1330018 RepID=A0A167K747_CALVF|nr:hypothetical protein CALVIDRAFT_599998 [Calocera viscosa TUFC12733]
MSAAPPISYEAQCKAILTKKTMRMHVLLSLLSVALSIALTLTLSALRLRPGLWPAFSPLVWAYGLAMYAGVVAPVLVLRKAQLSTERLTPRTLRALLASPAHRALLATYSGSAGAFAFLFLRLLRLPPLGGDMDGKLLLYSKQTGAAIVNERPLLLSGVMLLFGALYGTMQVLIARRCVTWPSPDEVRARAVPIPAPRTNETQQSLPIPASISRALSVNLGAALRTSLACSAVSVFLYRLGGRDAAASLALLIIPLPILARSADYARRHEVLSPVLLCKLSLASVSLALLWELTNAFFDAYTSRPVRSPRLGAPNNKLLFTGLRAQTPYFQQQAWLEFARLCKGDEKAKKALFEDMSPEYALALGGVSAKSGLWGAVAREGMILLGDDYGMLKRRGKAATAAAAAPALPKAQQQQSFKSLPSSQALQPLPRASGTEALLKSVSSLPAPPGVAQAASMLLKRGQDIGGVKKMEADFALAGKQVEGFVGGVKGVLGVGPQAPTVPGLDEILPRRELDLWIIDSLSYLIASSPLLDKYGLSTRTAPSLLEALTRYETELQSLLQELHERVSASEMQALALSQQQLTVFNAPELAVRRLWAWLAWRGIGREREGIELVVDSLTGTGEAIRRGLRTYGEEMVSFRFPPAVARKLRTYVPGAM